MKTIIFSLINNYINIGTQEYMWSDLYQEKPSKIRFYLAIIISFLVSYLTYSYVDTKMKFALIYLVLVIVNNFLFKQKIFKTIITSFLTIITLIIAEITYTIFLLVFQIEISDIISTYANTLMTNLVINFLALVLFHILKIKVIYHKYLSKIPFDRKNLYLVMPFVIIVIINLIVYQSYYLNLPRLSLFVVSLISVIIYILMMLKILKEEKDATIKKLENDFLIENLKSYEEILDFQRITNHESKNQLIVIKSMLTNKNNKTKKYIDALLNEVYHDNEELLFKTKRIPDGGLQGLIYQKFLRMEAEGIKSGLHINKNTDIYQLRSLSAIDIQQICQILGIILDNAIESAVNSKEKVVSVNFYQEKNTLIISVSNSYSGNIEIENIKSVRKTSKGIGRGYGLTIIEKVINKNNRLENITTISNEYFKQIIKIKM